MSTGVLTPLTNNASVGAINDYNSKGPALAAEQSGQHSVFSSHKGSLLGRDGQPGNQSNMNLRSKASSLNQPHMMNPSNATPLGVSGVAKPWDQQQS